MRSLTSVRTIGGQTLAEIHLDALSISISFFKLDLSIQQVLTVAVDSSIAKLSQAVP